MVFLTAHSSSTLAMLFESKKQPEAFLPKRTVSTEACGSNLYPHGHKPFLLEQGIRELGLTVIHDLSEHDNFLTLGTSPTMIELMIEFMGDWTALLM